MMNKKQYVFVFYKQLFVDGQGEKGWVRKQVLLLSFMTRPSNSRSHHRKRYVDEMLGEGGFWLSKYNVG